MPVYNRPQGVVQALNSVLAQTVAIKRLVIADDGSTDNTAEVVRTWIDQCSNAPFEICMLDLPNGGVSFARNQGFATLHDCDTVVFLDSDDQLHNNFIEVTADILSSNSQLAAVSAGLPDHATEDLEKYMLLYGAELASNTLFRCTIIKNMGGFDEALLSGQDSDLFFKIADEAEWAFTDKTNIERAVKRLPADHDRIQNTLFVPLLRWSFTYKRLMRYFKKRKRMHSERATPFHAVLSTLMRRTVKHDISAREKYYASLPPMVVKSLFFWCHPQSLWHRAIGRFHRLRIFTRIKTALLSKP